MSFSVSRTTRKRLARTNPVPDAEPTFNVEIATDLYIVDYTDRSFVVMGDTLNHSNALVTLGGKYNANLRIGNGWIFAKVREASVRKYIETGEIEPYIYSKEQQAQYEKRSSNSVGITEQQLRKIFQEFRNAFDAEEDYDGHSIIEVIYQLEERYLPSKSVLAKKKEKITERDKPKRLARKVVPETKDDGKESESEESMESEDEYEYSDDE